MKTPLHAAAAAFISLALVHSAEAAPTPLAATLRVSVDGITGAGGTLRVGLYDEATFALLPDTPLFKREVGKASGTGVVTFERLPPGTYAVKVFQDINNNGRFEVGEPSGISNGAARDSFDAAAVVLQPGPNMTIVHLR